MNFIIGVIYDLWNVMLDVPTIITKIGEDGKIQDSKGKSKLDAVDKINVQNNVKDKNIIICEICPDKYNRISFYSTAKEISDTLQMPIRVPFR